MTFDGLGTANLADSTDGRAADREIRTIDVADIDDSGRLRPVDEVVAAGIAASIAQVGLIHPLMVCRLPGQSGYRLVAGGHRLAAVRMAGWSQVRVMVCSADALERRSIEIQENFFRAALSPLDQARFVSELIEVEKARQGIAPDRDGRGNNARPSKKETEFNLCIVHKSIGLQEAVAIKLGLNRSTVSRHLALNGIATSFLDRVRATPIAGHAGQLRALAKLHWTDQDAVLGLIEAGDAKDVTTAQALRGQAAVMDPARKRARTFIDTFARMGQRERLGALSLLSALLPKGVRIEADDVAAFVAAAAEAGEHLRGAKDAPVVTEDEAALSREMREQREALAAELRGAAD